MLRFLLRALGFLLLAVAFAAIVVDGTRSIAGRELSLFSLGDTISRFKPALTGALAQAAGRAGAPGARTAAAVLATPTWLVAGVLGLLLLAAGRRPRRRVGWSGRDP